MKTVMKFVAATVAALFCAAGSAGVVALCVHDLAAGRFHGVDAFAATACSIAFAGFGAIASWGYGHIAGHIFTKDAF